MALVKLAKEGYGQLERNRFQNHNIEAQCELDASAFPNGAEVGSIVAVDKPKVLSLGLADASVPCAAQTQVLFMHYYSQVSMLLSIPLQYFLNIIGRAVINTQHLKLILRQIASIDAVETSLDITLHVVTRDHKGQ